MQQHERIKDPETVRMGSKRAGEGVKYRSLAFKPFGAGQRSISRLSGAHDEHSRTTVDRAGKCCIALCCCLRFGNVGENKQRGQ